MKPKENPTTTAQASGMTDNEAAARGAIPGTTGPAPEKSDRGGRTAGDAPLVAEGGKPGTPAPEQGPTNNPLPPAEPPTEVVQVTIERPMAPDGQPLTGPQTV